MINIMFSLKLYWKICPYCNGRGPGGWRGSGDLNDHLTTTWVKFCLKTTMVVMVAIMLQNLEKRSNCTLKFESKRPLTTMWAKLSLKTTMVVNLSGRQMVARPPHISILVWVTFTQFVVAAIASRYLIKL